MSVPWQEIDEFRLLTLAELAEFIKTMRNERKWSQATLAEIAGIKERTVQRVESGEPSNFDTRRALARAFEYEDLDVFNKPFPNIERLKAYLAELEKTTVVVPITRIEDARALRTMWERAGGSAAEELGELSTDAREAFASIVDYLRDYNDIRKDYSMTQRLEVDRDIDELLKTSVGWTMTKTSSGGYLLCGPSGEYVFASSTPSDWRALANLKSQIKRETAAKRADARIMRAAFRRCHSDPAFRARFVANARAELINGNSPNKRRSTRRKRTTNKDGAA